MGEKSQDTPGPGLGPGVARHGAARAAPPASASCDVSQQAARREAGGRGGRGRDARRQRRHWSAQARTPSKSVLPTYVFVSILSCLSAPIAKASAVSTPHNHARVQTNFRQTKYFNLEAAASWPARAPVLVYFQSLRPVRERRQSKPAIASSSSESATMRNARLAAEVRHTTAKLWKLGKWAARSRAASSAHYVA